MEIIEDWTAIKKALKQAEKQDKKKKDGMLMLFISNYIFLNHYILQ